MRPIMDALGGENKIFTVREDGITIRDVMEIAKVIINLLVGLVVFVVGMNMMSTGLKNSAGRSIRRLFKRIGNNRIAAASIGAGTTALIQSSGATTVMVVGFLSAGALTFIQGYALMTGAFVGTTVTGLLVSLSSFSFSMFLMATAFIGFILGFFKSPTLKSIGEILIGFGILFFGLEAMKGAFNNTDIQNALVSFLSSVNFPLLLMLFGAILTAITQSSSATNGIVIVMVAANPALLSSGFYLVIGATVGALMPTILAALKSGIEAKRLTYSMLILRALFAVIATLVLWAVSVPMFGWLDTFPQEDVGLLLAIFTVIYNLLFVLVALPLAKPIESLSKKVFRDRDAEKRRQALRYIDESVLGTPAVAILLVKQEIVEMFRLAKENFFLGYRFIIDQDLTRAKELEDREETIDYLNSVISDYLIRLSLHASIHEEKKIGSYYHVINDIERIGDHGYNFLESARKMKDADLMFSDTAKKEFDEMEKLLDEMFAVAERTFIDHKKKDLETLRRLEDESDALNDRLAAAHFERITKNECKNELSPFHSTFLSELERVADHLTNVGYSVENPTGDEVSHKPKKY